MGYIKKHVYGKKRVFCKKCFTHWRFEANGFGCVTKLEKILTMENGHSY